MKLAIHNSKFGFHPRWIAYCERMNIPFKRVNCFSNDLVAQTADCQALMWHVNQGNQRDMMLARQILAAFEHTGTLVFPDFRTAWHFDDKLGQKFLFERIEAPIVPTYAFFDKAQALAWIKQTSFPKVFKLRGGAGSQNVSLIYNQRQAHRLVRQAFGKGFPKYHGWSNLKERWYKYRRGKGAAKEVLKGIIRLLYPPAYARLGAREAGYLYFQDFIPQNDSDIRIIVIGDRAFGLKRYVRENDFRASGSGNCAYDRDLFDERFLKISFSIQEQLKLQVAALDFVFTPEGLPLVVEISYGYNERVYDPCPGYWDRELIWHEAKTIKEEWIVDLVLKQINDKN